MIRNDNFLPFSSESSRSSGASCQNFMAAYQQQCSQLQQQQKNLQHQQGLSLLSHPELIIIIDKNKPRMSLIQ